MTVRQKRQIFKLVLVLLFILASGFLGQFSQDSSLKNQAVDTSTPLQAGYYRVISFTDGDTFDIDMNGSRETVRLIGIDTPETHRPNSPVQCYGVAASEFTKKKLLEQGAQVRLEADPTNTNRDRYNRLLRYAYLKDGRLINKVIISEGYGFAYVSFPFEKMEEFKQAEKDAKNGAKGLWKDCTTSTQSNGREQTQDVSP